MRERGSGNGSGKLENELRGNANGRLESVRGKRSVNANVRGKEKERLANAKGRESVSGRGRGRRRRWRGLRR